MELLLHSTPLFMAGVFVLGLIIGSFLNVLIVRLPLILEYEWKSQCKELLELQGDTTEKPPLSIGFSRSRCPQCNYQLKFWENIPVLSYIFLKGRCSNCIKPISIKYPIVELLTAILFLIVAWHFGVSVQTLSGLALTSFLIVLAGIDIEHQLLPDNLTQPLLWSGILLSFWSIHTDLESSVLGAVIGYMALWIIYQTFRVLTGKEGMGYGDFKLMAALGAWMGWQVLPLIILLSSVLGAGVGIGLMIFGKHQKDQPLPFGPFIALAGWIALIFGASDLEIPYLSTRFG